MLTAKIISPHTHFCDIKIHTLNHFFLCYESPICCVLSPQKEMGFIYHMRCQLSGFGVPKCIQAGVTSTTSHQQMDLAKSFRLLDKSKIGNMDLLKECISSVQFSRSVVSDSLWPHESRHARPPCSSPSPRVHSDSRPSSPWCHPAISSWVVPFSSCP